MNEEIDRTIQTSCTQHSEKQNGEVIRLKRYRQGHPFQHTAKQYRCIIVIPKDFGYFFVRPGVNQQITFTSLIPDDIRFVLARAAFKYVQSDDLHTIENVFEVMPTAMLATSQPL